MQHAPPKQTGHRRISQGFVIGSAVTFADRQLDARRQFQIGLIGTFGLHLEQYPKLQALIAGSRGCGGGFGCSDHCPVPPIVWR